MISSRQLQKTKTPQEYAEKDTGKISPTDEQRVSHEKQ
jgi:hypothetical protein